MCAVFGLIDYAKKFTAKQRGKIISILSKECEIRGTDATGIAYNSNGKLHIYKRAIPAHKMRYRLPKDANIIMGHTRMTTQGSEAINYNNHSFLGNAGNTNFAFAHNGVLYNDKLLRQEENLPETPIQTDSYVSVQLIEKENTLGFESLKNMAEKTEGSFCYTVLSDRNELYIVKGDNPIALYKFDGFYIYASTDEIMQNTLQKLSLPECSRVNVECGDILKINSKGEIDVRHFNFQEYNYMGYGHHFIKADREYLEEIAAIYGLETEDILTLIDFGYDVFEIEEMLYFGDTHEFVSEIMSFEMM